MWEILLVVPSATVPGQVKIIARSGARVLHIERVPAESVEGYDEFESIWQHRKFISGGVK